MAARLPAGLHLSAKDCAMLDGLLLRALRDMQLRDGGAPSALLEVVAPIHRMAVEFRENMLVGAGSGTGEDGIGSVEGSSVSSERLSVQEAARLTGLSESYLRRLARRGDLEGSQSGLGRGRGWLLDGGAVAVLMADRKDRHREAA